MLLKANFPPVLAPEKKKQTTHRSYHSSTTNFLIRNLLLLPKLSFFSKSTSAALGRAVPGVLSDIFFSPTGISTPGCSGRCSSPEPPCHGLGEALWFDGCRAQGWVCWSWRGCQAEIPLCIQRSHNSCSTSPPLLRLSAALTSCPEWCFCSDKFCRGR